MRPSARAASVPAIEVDHGAKTWADAARGKVAAEDPGEKKKDKPRPSSLSRKRRQSQDGPGSRKRSVSMEEKVQHHAFDPNLGGDDDDENDDMLLNSKIGKLPGHGVMTQLGLICELLSLKRRMPC